MYKKLSSKVIFKHPRLVVEEDEIELESGQKGQYLRYGYGGDGVVIIARNDEDKILFLREYSYVVDRKLLQFPMGKIEGNESIPAAANREFQEETSYRAEKLEEVGFYFQNHRRSVNKGFVVLASDLSSSKLESDDEEGDIEEVWFVTDEIPALIKAGEIVDADTLSSLRICGL